MTRSAPRKETCSFQYILSDIEEYDSNPPFSPPQRFPEYAFKSLGTNRVYVAFRNLLHKSQLDIENYGTSKWNPLGAWIKPGQKVLVKPNLVLDSSWLSSSQFPATVVQGAFLRPVIDYALKALDGKGILTIADGSVDIADFSSIVAETGISALVEWYSRNGIEIKLLDLRPECLVRKGSVALGKTSISLMLNKRLSGDPRGHRWIDLGNYSSFAGLPSRSLARLRSTQLVRTRKGPAMIHTETSHPYPIAATVLDSDCIISVAKLKTHKKLGVTLGLKNMVGMIVPRFWLPHFRAGPPPEGDEHPGTVRFLSRILTKIQERLVIRGRLKLLFSTKEVVADRKGSWHGNDTLWRVALDLCKCILFTDSSGQLMSDQKRSYLSIVDGIVAGEFDGPLNPTPHPAGFIAIGSNPLAVDEGCIRIMGFEPKEFSMIERGQTDSLMKTYGRYEINIPSKHLLSLKPALGWDRIVRKT